MVIIMISDITRSFLSHLMICQHLTRTSLQPHQLLTAYSIYACARNGETACKVFAYINADYTVMAFDLYSPAAYYTPCRDAVIIYYCAVPPIGYVHAVQVINILCCSLQTVL